MDKKSCYASPRCTQRLKMSNFSSLQCTLGKKSMQKTWHQTIYLSYCFIHYNASTFPTFSDLFSVTIRLSVGNNEEKKPFTLRSSLDTPVERLGPETWRSTNSIKWKRAKPIRKSPWTKKSLGSWVNDVSQDGRATETRPSILESWKNSLCFPAFLILQKIDLAVHKVKVMKGSTWLDVHEKIVVVKEEKWCYWNQLFIGI